MSPPLHTTQQNLHFSRQLRTALSLIKTSDERALWHDCKLSRGALDRLCRGLPTSRWDWVIAWFEYSGKVQPPGWPIHGWLWEPSLEAIYEPISAGPYRPENYLEAICAEKELFLWQVKNLVQDLHKGKSPKRLPEMYRGQILPIGLSLIPILGMALRVPIRPFLPSGWPVSVKT